MSGLAATLADFIVNWIDLIWLPIGYYVATRRQRVWVMAFMLVCALTMRLQIALVHSTGYINGFTQIFDTDVKLRATLIYGLFCAAYLVMMHFSPRGYWSVWLSAGIVVYITAFCVSMLAMTL